MRRQMRAMGLALAIGAAAAASRGAVADVAAPDLVDGTAIVDVVVSTANGPRPGVGWAFTAKIGDVEECFIVAPHAIVGRKGRFGAAYEGVVIDGEASDAVGAAYQRRLSKDLALLRLESEERCRFRSFPGETLERFGPGLTFGRITPEKIHLRRGDAEAGPRLTEGDFETGLAALSATEIASGAALSELWDGGSVAWDGRRIGMIVGVSEAGEARFVTACGLQAALDAAEAPFDVFDVAGCAAPPAGPDPAPAAQGVKDLSTLSPPPLAPQVALVDVIVAAGGQAEGRGWAVRILDESLDARDLRCHVVTPHHVVGERGRFGTAYRDIRVDGVGVNQPLLAHYERRLADDLALLEIPIDQEVEGGCPFQPSATLAEGAFESGLGLMRVNAGDGVDRLPGDAESIAARDDDFVLAAAKLAGDAGGEGVTRGWSGSAVGLDGRRAGMVIETEGGDGFVFYTACAIQHALDQADAPLDLFEVTPCAPIKTRFESKAPTGTDARLVPAYMRVEVSNADPRALPDFGLFKECADCPEMVALPTGAYQMGLAEDEPANSRTPLAARPAKTITFAERFAIARFETTALEWGACARDGYCSTGAVSMRDEIDRPRRPRQNVQHDAIIGEYRNEPGFLAWLNAHAVGAPYRLPSEAEWEYAARAGSETRYPWGAEPSREHANYGKDSNYGEGVGGRDVWMEAAPVGSFPSNPFGLFDMHGNLAEWTADCPRGSKGFSAHPSDGRAVLSLICWTDPSHSDADRVVRGGSYYEPPLSMRSADRNDLRTPGSSQRFIGFRVARSLSTQSEDPEAAEFAMLEQLERDAAAERPANALDELRQALTFRRNRLERKPEDEARREELAAALHQYAETALRAGRAKAAADAAEESAALWRALEAAAPDDAARREALAAAYALLADAQAKAPNAEAAEAAWDEAIAMRRAFAEADPSAERLDAIAALWRKRAESRLKRRQRDDAAAAFEEEARLRGAIIAQAPEDRAAATAHWLALWEIAEIDDSRWPEVLAAVDAAKARGIFEEEEHGWRYEGLTRRAAGAQVGAIADPNALYDAGDYSGAFEASRRRLGPLEQAVASGARYEEDLLSALGAHSWFALKAGDPVAAETAARAALSRDPSKAWIAMNLAHALMLQDRREEADAGFDAHRGRRLNSGLWEDIVLQDFADLRQAGISHPHMDALQKRWLTEAKFLARLPDPRDAFEDENYVKALIESEDRVARIEEGVAEGALGDAHLVEALRLHTGYALFAQDFEAAQAAAARALEFSPDTPRLALNLAHALMYLGRLEEADTLYLGRRGEPTGEDGEPWEDVVEEDFEALTAAGRGRPHMERVLDRLNE